MACLACDENIPFIAYLSNRVLAFTLCFKCRIFEYVNSIKFDQNVM